MYKKKCNRNSPSTMGRSLFRIAKLTLVLSVVFCLRASASVDSQNIKLTFQVNNKSLEEIFKEIEQQSNFHFIYYSPDLKNKALINHEFSLATINEILDKCLSGTKLTYKIQDNHIIIKPDNQKVEKKNRTIRGHVFDPMGSPIFGATIAVWKNKDLITGTSTDDMGEFTLIISKETEEIEVSFIGMETQKVRIDNKEHYAVHLKKSLNKVEEVVVTGFQEIKKDRMTGSFSVITAKDLESEAITSIDQALEGRISGINSTISSGAPGERAQIRIRGNNSINGNNEPLWVIDGLPELNGVPKIKGDLETTIMTDGIGNIHPNEIASVTVLKDASAAAIYGARAANGVIVVTTKKGYKGKTSFSYNGNLSYETQRRPDPMYMNSNEKIDYELSLIEEFNTSAYGGSVSRLWEQFNKGYISREAYNNEITRLRGINTNWMDVIFRPAKSQSHSVNVRGGTDRITYYTGLNIKDQQGILRGNHYQNIGVSSRMDYKPSTNFHIGVDLRGNATENKTHNSAVDPLTYAIYANPYEKPYDDQGNYYWDRSYVNQSRKENEKHQVLPPKTESNTGEGYLFNFNILNELENTLSKQKGTDISLSLNLSWRITEGLMLTSRYRNAKSNYTTLNSVNPGTYSSYLNAMYAKIFWTHELPNPYNNGSLKEGSESSSSWAWRNQVEYSKELESGHFFGLLVANELTSKDFNRFGYRSPEYLPKYRQINVPEFPASTPLEKYREEIKKFMYTEEGQDRSVSFIGNLAYSYKSKYNLNFTYRADGADAIGDSQRFTPLWSVGAKINLHKETFLKNSSFLNELSFRGSFGYTGNIDRSAYPFTILFMGSDRYSNQYIPDRISWPNPNIKWEKKTDRNLGLDLSLFDYRLSLSANMYWNDLNDLLGIIDVPQSTGRKTAIANTLSMTNKGWELNVSIKWFKNKDWLFSTRANISHNTNKITKALRDDPSKLPDTGGYYNVSGYETGTVFGYKFGGVDPKTGNPTFVLGPQAKKDLQKWLDTEWATMNDQAKETYIKDGLTNTKNAQSTYNSRVGLAPAGIGKKSIRKLGSLTPKIVGGFSTFLKYKRFEFGSQWSFKTGHILASYQGNRDASIKNSQYNKLKFLNYRWRNVGDRTDIPRFTQKNEYDHYTLSNYSNKYEKGDYLRLQSIMLSWYLPKKWNDKIGVNTTKIGLQGRDLLTFTKYSGLDVATGGAARYPISKKFIVNLSLSF